MFNGKTHYKWPFSIAMLVYQRVVQPTHINSTLWCHEIKGGSDRVTAFTTKRLDEVPKVVCSDLEMWSCPGEYGLSEIGKSPGFQTNPHCIHLFGYISHYITIIYNYIYNYIYIIIYICMYMYIYVYIYIPLSLVNLSLLYPILAQFVPPPPLTWWLWDLSSKADLSKFVWLCRVCAET